MKKKHVITKRMYEKHLYVQWYTITKKKETVQHRYESRMKEKDRDNEEKQKKNATEIEPGGKSPNKFDFPLQFIEFSLLSLYFIIQQSGFIIFH